MIKNLLLIIILLLCINNVISLELYNLSIIYTSSLSGRLFPVNRFGADCTLQKIQENNETTDKCWGGVARRHVFINEKRLEYNNATIVLDTGGSFFGSIFFDIYRGNVTIDIFKRLNYNLLTMDISDLFETTKFYAKFVKKLFKKHSSMLPIIASNLNIKYDQPLNTLNSSMYTLNRVINIKNRKIGIISIWPKSLLTKVSALKHNISIDDAIQSVWLETAKLELLSAPPNIIIVVTHLSLSENKNLIQKLVGIDLLLAPAISTDIPFITYENDAIGKQVPIAGSFDAFGRELGFVNITFDEFGHIYKVDGQRIQLRQTLYNESNAFDTWNYTLNLNTTVNNMIRNQTIGKALNNWSGNCKKIECEMGNVIADAMRFSTKTQIAFWNGGGVRSSIDAGNIRNVDVLLAVPFQNRMNTFTMRGDHILELLQHSITEYDNGGFLQVSGLKFKWNTDTNVPLYQRVGAVQISKTGTLNSEYEFLDTEAYYTLTTNDFLMNGGDGYDILKNTKKTLTIDLSYPEVDQTVSLYIKSFGNNGLQQNIENRIVESNEIFVNILIRIGSFFENDGEDYSHFKLALARLNNPTDGYFDDLVPGLRFSHINDPNDCDSALAGPAVLKFKENNCLAIVGADCSGASTSSASIAKVFKFPQVSYASTSPLLSDSTVYPYFNRVVPPDNLQGDALTAVLKYFGWKSVAVLHDDSLYGTGIDRSFRNKFLADPTNKIVEDLNMVTLSGDKQNLNVDFERIKPILLQLQAAKPRVIILATGSRNIFEVFGAVYKYQILKPPNVIWVGVDGWASDSIFSIQLNTTDATLRDNIINTMRGSIALIPLKARTPKFIQYLNDWKTLNDSEYLDANNNRDDVSTFGPFAYDSLSTLAYAYDKVIRDNISVTDGDKVLNALRSKTLIGVTGKISFDKNGDRLDLPYALVNINSINETWEQKGFINGSELQLNNSITFPDGSKYAPVDGRGLIILYDQIGCTGNRVQLTSSNTLCGLTFSPNLEYDLNSCPMTGNINNNKNCVQKNVKSMEIRLGYTLVIKSGCESSSESLTTLTIISSGVSSNTSNVFSCRNIPINNNNGYIDIFEAKITQSTIEDATGVLVVAFVLTLCMILLMLYFYTKKSNRAKITERIGQDSHKDKKKHAKVVAAKSLADALFRDLLVQFSMISLELLDLFSDWLVARSVLNDDETFASSFRYVYLATIMLATVFSTRSVFERIRLIYSIHKERTDGIKTAFTQILADAKNPVVMLNRTNRDMYGFHLSWILLAVEDVPMLSFGLFVLQTHNVLDWTILISLFISFTLIGAKMRGFQMYFHLRNRRRALRAMIASKTERDNRSSVSRNSKRNQSVSVSSMGGVMPNDISMMIARQVSDSSSKRSSIDQRRSVSLHALGPVKETYDDEGDADENALIGMNLSRYESVYSVTGMRPRNDTSPSSVSLPSTTKLYRRPTQRNE